MGSLFDLTSYRLYLTAAERVAFLVALPRLPPADERAFLATLIAEGTNLGQSRGEKWPLVRVSLQPVATKAGADCGRTYQPWPKKGNRCCGW